MPKVRFNCLLPLTTIIPSASVHYHSSVVVGVCANRIRHTSKVVLVEHRIQLLGQRISTNHDWHRAPTRTPRQIMLMLPTDIEQKFAVVQVSRFWRDVALDNHLFWSSFTAQSQADCYRLPLLLERSGSSTTLHIHLRFRPTPSRLASSLGVLIPNVARIETLDMHFVHKDIEALLGTSLEFPALRTLSLRTSPSVYQLPLNLLFTAPQLRTVDMQGIQLQNWAALLSPSLESIRIWGNSTAEMFVGVLQQCPRVSRIAMQSADPWYTNATEDLFMDFSHPPLAPALRELELELYEQELCRVLKTGFSDVVLHKVKGCLCSANVGVLADALLLGLGPLVSFRLDYMQDLELRDEAGHIRHFQCWNEDSRFEVKDVWEYLSIHHGLNKTVRELHIHPEHWHEYLDIFDAYTPQLQDGITLAINTRWEEFPQIDDDEGEWIRAWKILRLPGLAKVKFCGEKNSDYFLQTISDVLALIEPPTVRKVEVCIELATGVQDALLVLQGALGGSSSWTICSHCVPAIR
ncbi:hypothetical protein MSAN_01254600 [Mycena sanguinolenta]|uniref:F-box domain-containing protein n=1 Tax=Mycena sanguinolenta TaxID=230812 RepID=A0A8H6YDK5_9AGAR|nr:hypothetical protein MSAN_01254600 [Mycena sanguinolenta]